MDEHNIGKVIPISIEHSMKSAFIDYAMSVIMDRSLPDVRDGLKPVHRRVLWAMKELGCTHMAPYKKSARIVGDTIGKYHPHGDQAAYQTLVRMAQPFSMRYILVKGQGNFGSVDGDSAAAMRYTEARMTKISSEILADIEKDTVKMNPNYDGTLPEPEVMPTRIPTLLINGSSGIAVGMACNLPPHNLTEVVNGTIAMIDNPDITLPELMQYITGPDFPTEAMILGRDGIRQAYETGRGSVKMRADVTIENGDERKNSKKDALIINRLPYQVNKARLIEKIRELKDDKILGMGDIRDESDKHGMRVVIELKRDADSHIILNQLYKMTDLQTSFGVNMLAICNGVPRRLNLIDILKYFILHRRDVVTRRTKFELNKAEERAHILEGLKIALDNIQEIIKIIRASASTEAARKSLMSTFDFSLKQAKSILDMKLSRLTGLERDKIINELAELMAKISWCKEVLADETKLFGVIKDELKEIIEKYGDERKTEILNYEGELNYEDLIPDDDMIVTLTTENYIKRTPLDLYRKQKRGGKGINAIDPKENDYVKNIFIASSRTQLLIFTNYGKVYWTKVYQLPETGRKSRGKPIVNLIQVEKDEKVAAILPIKEFTENSFLMFATANGVVKKTDMMEFARPRSTGKIAIKLRDGDRLIGVQISNGDDEVVLATKLGLSIRFHENDIRSMGRTAAGVRGVRLSAGNEVMTMDLIEEGKTLLAITDKGMGKRTAMDEYRKQSRGGKGVITIKTSETNGYVIGLLKVDELDEAMLITSNGQAIRFPVNGISVIGRNTKGVRLFRLAKDEKVVAITRIADPEEEISEPASSEVDTTADTPTDETKAPSSDTPTE